MRNNKLFKRMVAATTTLALVGGGVAPITAALAEPNAELPTPNGWVWDEGKWYHFDNGALTTGWFSDPDYANAMFYLKDDGVMATDWEWIDGEWYFFGTSGRMKTGWIWSESYKGWYYMNELPLGSKHPLGAMLRNTTATDGSYVDANGRWTMTPPAAEVAVAGTYCYTIKGDDWGCGVDKVIVSTDETLDSVSASDFTVTERKEAIDWTDPSYPSIVAKSERTVKDAYFVDEEGKKSDKPTQLFAIDLEISPSEGSPFVWSPKSFYNTLCDPYELKISLSKDAKLTADGKAVAALRVSTDGLGYFTSADDFKLDSHETESGITYQYGAYEPEGGSDTLVVWLHGMGEGQGVDVEAGNTPIITLLGNKVTALAGDAFQEKLGGAHILVPQAPTYWMDKDGTAANKLTRLDSDGSSYYTESLEQLIDWYAAKVGAKKIVLTGASNGGYMVLNLALSRPNAYAAVVPISETIQDKYLTDDDIAKLVNVPLFFVYCNADTTAVAANCSIPTIERLQAAGATPETLMWSSSDAVIDTSGRFKASDGESPYTYSGHWAWIYFDNDEAIDDTDGKTSAWDFIAKQVNRTNA